MGVPLHTVQSDYYFAMKKIRWWLHYYPDLLDTWENLRVAINTPTPELELPIEVNTLFSQEVDDTISDDELDEVIKYFEETGMKL